MQTDDLIATLAADSAATPSVFDRRWLAAVGSGAAIAAILFAWLLGPRADIAAAMHTVRFDYKFVITSSLAFGGLVVLRRLARPGAAHAHDLSLLCLAPALLALGMAAELVMTPSTRWFRLAVGDNSHLCMTFIPILSVAPLVLALYALSRSAPTRPMLAGGVAGLMSAGIGATFYAAQCTDDSPLFLSIWYVLASGLVAIVGAVAGGRVARW
jgi:hypothetical protein